MRNTIWQSLVIIFLTLGLALACASQPDIMETKENRMTSIYAFTMRDITGNEIQLDQYRGKVLLIVNVASKCGFTPQYAGLQKLYEDYEERGFFVLGFPANNFLGQEPGTDSQILEFCTREYSVTFPMFSKISVRGRDQHPLYGFLTAQDTAPEPAGNISWNFNKFLIGRNGDVLARYGSRTRPDDPELVEALEKALSVASDE